MAEPKVALNGDSQLEYTQEIRKRVIQGLLPVDQAAMINADPKIINTLLNALKDHDKVTLTLKRIEADNENADADRQALAMFHSLSQKAGARDLMRVDEEGRDGPPAFDESEIPETEVVDGETLVGLDPVNFDTFMVEQREKARASKA